MQIKLVVQINGKTEIFLEVKKDISEKDLNKLTAKSTKLKKYLVDKKISRTIFVKNKIINYII